MAYARAAMHVLRAFFAHHRALAAFLIAAALCMKALIPAGYMIGSGDRVLTVKICADARGTMQTQQIVIPGSGGQRGDKAEHGKADGTCPFSALSFASLGGTDPALLALALIFILTLGFRPSAAPRTEQIFYLRPPLRGPPALV